MNPSPSQPSNAPRMDAETFIGFVQVSRLIDPEELQKALKRMPVTDRGRTVARYLVEQKLLTRFQAERLLMGRTEGFVIGQYRILDRLGKGGMGRVYKAEHATMGRAVALKFLNANLVKTERARLLFDREVRAAAKLNHPNIATAFDANQIDDRCYLVMEFVDGPNLQDLVKQKGPLPVTQACDFIRQTAIGLQCAHDLGMVHRDIKPANLLVTKNASKATPGSYVIKILDFGLARLNSTGDGNVDDSILTNKQTVMGTPDYLSPEQARCLHEADHRSDLYSLGCTFYYLLTGRVPFPGGSALEKMVKQTTDEPEPVEKFRPDVSPEVAAVVCKLMAKDPANRFQTATELAELLDHFADEGANWLAIAPIPSDEQIAPISGNLSEYAGSIHQPTPGDPWAGLDDDSPQTHAGLSGQTRVTTGTTSRLRLLSDRPSRNPAWLTWLMLGGIGLACAVALWAILKWAT